ncbi:MAG: 50S ribosomal protein L10 [Candidatus Omnitrophica bacterium]|nr:50S ribosomal protein L10 [Candidatus Omnitrophota bacterium]
MSSVSYGQLSKKLLISGLTDDVEKCEQVFVTSFSALSVNTIAELRKALRDSGVKYRIVKNTLIKRVAADKDMSDLSQAVNGQCGIGLSSGEVTAVSKIFTKFSEDNETFQVQGLYFDGKYYDSKQVKKLASLPSREELLAKLCSSMQSPLYGFVSVLSGTVRGFVSVVDQVRKQKEQS